MTYTETESTQTKRRSNKDYADPEALLVQTYRENPDATDSEVNAIFLKKLRNYEFEEYQLEINRKFLSLNGNSAHRAAFPPTLEEITARAAEKAAEKQRKREEEAKLMAKIKLISVLTLDLDIDGKKLSEHTFGWAGTLGGELSKLSTLGEPDELIGQKFKNDKALKKALANLERRP